VLQPDLALLQRLEAACPAGASVSDLLADSSPERSPWLETTLVWLATLGLVDWLGNLWATGV